MNDYFLPPSVVFIIFFRSLLTRFFSMTFSLPKSPSSVSLPYSTGGWDVLDLLRRVGMELRNPFRNPGVLGRQRLGEVPREGLAAFARLTWLN
jgi:hypothetical protein